MQTDGSGLADSARGSIVSEQEARQELERILSDPDFHCTERNRKFLRFVSEEFFHGRENTVKAYTIAVDVFGRASSFDPSTDPIVRIEATRLRAALVRHYELHGHDRPVRIDLPKGRYVPIFSRVEENPTPDAGIAEREPISASVRHEPRRSRLYPSVRSRWLAASIGVAGGVLAGAMLFAFDWQRGGEAQSFSHKPNLAIEMRLGSGLDENEALAFRDALMVALSGFQTVRISAPDANTASTGATSSSATRPAGVQGRYRLLLKYGADGSGTVLWWQVIDETDGEALRSGAERLDSWQAEQPVLEIASQLAVRLASAKGLINTLETARELDHPSLGNGCILRATMATDSKDKEALGQARDCLERTLAVRYNDADAHAMLAAVLLKIDPSDAPTELTDQAVTNAERAVALAPDSERSYFAQMITQFRVGNPDAAILAGRRALDLNPYSPTTAAKLANILFVTGRWDEGVALAKTVHMQGVSMRDADATLAFDAYRRGQFDEALLLLNQMNNRDCYCLQLLRVATLGELGRIDEASSAIAELRRSRPQFETSLHADLARRQFAPPLVALIEAGLQKAGLKVA